MQDDDFFNKIWNDEKFQLPLTEEMQHLGESRVQLPPLKRPRPNNAELPSFQDVPTSESIESINEVVDSNNEIIRRIVMELKNIKDLLSAKKSKEEPSDYSSLFRLQDDYKYFLALDQPLEPPIYKEKNFDLRLTAYKTDDNRVIYQNDVDIPIAMSLYLAVNPPRKLETNMQGNNVIRINKQPFLINGKCLIKGVKIKEVTSHLPNGCVAIVFQAVGNSDIRPMIVDNIVVKAKRKKSN